VGLELGLGNMGEGLRLVQEFKKCLGRGVRVGVGKELGISSKLGLRWS